MGFISSLLRALCGSGQKDDNNFSYSQTTKPGTQAYPTLNDIPLGEWTDQNPNNSYKPSPNSKPSYPTSTLSSDSSQLSVNPTSEELSNIRLAVEKLWALDSNRLNPGLDYELYLQKSRKGEEVSQSFFRYVNEPRILTIPTFKFFYDLLDNYNSQVGIEEKMGLQELQEIDQFLKAFSQTKPGKYLHQYLVAKRLCSGDPISFQRKMNDIWFKLYRRDGKNDSSAFEHVFLGETRGEEVIGFHNWIYFYYEEKAGRLTYQGYVSPQHSHPLQNPSGKDHLFQVRFSWKDCIKPISSGFVGTSPEFEMALYTLCFLTEQDKVSASLSGIETAIVAHSFYSNNERKLGSCYPSIK